MKLNNNAYATIQNVCKFSPYLCHVNSNMKESALFIALLFVKMSLLTQTVTKADSIDTSAFDKYLDEIVIVAKKSGTIIKADRKVYTVNQDLMSKASSTSEILNHIPSVEVDIDGNVSMRGNTT